MKKALINFLDGLSSFLLFNVNDSRKTFHELHKISFKESAKFIYENGGAALLLEDKETFWAHAINNIPAKGMLLEFGVFKGTSINFFSSTLRKNKDPRTIHGFDSFEGLSEDWVGTHMTKSTFDLQGILPKVNENVNLIKGWLDDTLPPFVKENINSENKIAFIHVDMDTYTPTKVAFENTIDYLQVGTIIVFDELLGYAGWKDGEYKALMEVLAPRWEYEFISFCEPRMKHRHISKYVRAAIKITGAKTI